MESRRDRKAVAGEPDRRLEQSRPGQPSVALVRLLDQPDIARHADAEAARNDFAMRPRLAVRAEEPGRGRGMRRGLASVERAEPVAALVMVDEEAAAADARALRLD